MDSFVTIATPDVGVSTITLAVTVSPGLNEISPSKAIQPAGYHSYQAKGLISISLMKS